MKINFQSIFITASIVSLIFSTSCKKKGCTNENATNYDSKAKKDDGSCVLASVQTPPDQSETNTFVVNDTIDFSSISSSYDRSVRLTRTGIDATNNPISSSFYTITSWDTNTVGFFNIPNRNIEFSAGNGAFLYTEYTNGNTQLLQTKKFALNDIIDGNGNGGSTPNGSVSSKILEDNIQSSFTSNAIHYLGLSFKENTDEYHGWVKIKTLNNNYSCIILSYDVAQEANKAVSIK